MVPFHAGVVLHPTIIKQVLKAIEEASGMQCRTRGAGPAPTGEDLDPPAGPLSLSLDDLSRFFNNFRHRTGTPLPSAVSLASWSLSGVRTTTDCVAINADNEVSTRR